MCSDLFILTKKCFVFVFFFNFFLFVFIKFLIFKETLLTTNPKVTLSPAIPNISNSNTTFMRSGISPTCPRHGHAAQMMIAAAAAAAVSRANSVGTSNSFNYTNSVENTNLLNNYNGTPLLVPLISSSSPTKLEEAQV